MTDLARPSAADDGLAAAWLDAFQDVVDESAHGLKNVLNAVAVNLEVVRMRSGRGGDAVSVAPFAENAAASLDEVAAGTEALLALARPERVPIDVAAVLGRLCALHGVSRERPRVTVNGGGDQPAVTSASGLAVRTALARVLQSALSGGGEVVCEIGRSGDSFIRLTVSSSAEPQMDPAVVARLERQGIGVRFLGSVVELLFPALQR